MTMRFFSFLVILGTLVGTAPVYGQTPQPASGTSSATGQASQAGGTSSLGVTLPNPIKCDNATCLITQVIRYILGTIAVVATIMFVWGGILMLTSGGEERRIQQAKETLAWAAIGVVVILLSWTLIKFVLSALIANTSAPAAK